MEQVLKDTVKRELERMMKSTSGIDLALVDEDGLLLEEHIKNAQLEKFEDKVLAYLYEDCETNYDMWYKSEGVPFDAIFVRKNYMEHFGILDILHWFADAYVTSNYTDYDKNIFVYDYNWKNYSDREFRGVWFGRNQFFDVCELGMVKQGLKAWNNKHS